MSVRASTLERQGGRGLILFGHGQVASYCLKAGQKKIDLSPFSIISKLRGCAKVA